MSEPQYDVDAMAQEIHDLENPGGINDADPDVIAQEIYDLENKKKPLQGLVDATSGMVENMRKGPMGGMFQASDREVAGIHEAERSGLDPSQPGGYKAGEWQPFAGEGAKMSGVALGVDAAAQGILQHPAMQQQMDAFDGPGMALANPMVALGQSLKMIPAMMDYNVGETTPRQMLQGYVSKSPAQADSGFNDAPAMLSGMVGGGENVLSQALAQGAAAGIPEYFRARQKNVDKTGQADEGDALFKAAMSFLQGGALPAAGHLLGQFGKIFKDTSAPSSVHGVDPHLEQTDAGWSPAGPEKQQDVSQIPTPEQPSAADAASMQMLKGVDATQQVAPMMQQAQPEIPVPPQPTPMDAATMQLLRGIEGSHTPGNLDRPTPQLDVQGQVLPPQPLPAEPLPVPMQVQQNRLQGVVDQWDAAQQNPPTPNQPGPAVPADQPRVNQPQSDPLVPIALEHQLTSQPDSRRAFPVEPSQQPVVPPEHTLQGHVEAEQPQVQTAPAEPAPVDNPVAGPEPSQPQTIADLKGNGWKKGTTNKMLELDVNGQETGRYITYKKASDPFDPAKVKGNPKVAEQAKKGLQIVNTGETSRLNNELNALDDLIDKTTDPATRRKLRTQRVSLAAKAEAAYGIDKPILSEAPNRHTYDDAEAPATSSTVSADSAVGAFQNRHMGKEIDKLKADGSWQKLSKEEQAAKREEFKAAGAELAGNEHLEEIAKTVSGGKDAVQQTVWKKLGRYVKEGVKEEIGGYPHAAMDAHAAALHDAIKSVGGAMEALVNPSKIERAVAGGKHISALENAAHRAGIAIETRRTFDIIKNYSPGLWNKLVRGVSNEALDAHGIKFELGQENLVDRVMRGEDPFSMPELSVKQQHFLKNAFERRQANVEALNDEINHLLLPYGTRDAMPSPLKLIHDSLTQTRDALTGYRADPNTSRFTESMNALGEFSNNYLFRHNIGYHAVNRTDILTIGSAAHGAENVAKALHVQQTDRTVADFLAGFDAKGTMRQFKSDMRAERPNPKGVYDDPLTKMGKGIQKLQDKIPDFPSEDYNFRDALAASIIKKVGVQGLKDMARGKMGRERMVDILMDGLTGADEVTGAGLMGLNRDVVQRNPALRWLSQFTSQPLRVANLQRKWLSQGPGGWSKIAQFAAYTTMVGGSASIPRELDLVAEKTPGGKKFLHAVRQVLDTEWTAPDGSKMSLPISNIPGRASDAVMQAVTGEEGAGRSIREKLRYSAVLPLLSGVQSHVLMDALDNVFKAGEDGKGTENLARATILGALSVAWGGGGNQANKMWTAYENSQKGRKKKSIYKETGLRPNVLRHPIGKMNIPYSGVDAIGDAVGIGRGRGEENTVDRANRFKAGAGY